MVGGVPLWSTGDGPKACVYSDIYLGVIAESFSAFAASGIFERLLR